MRTVKGVIWLNLEMLTLEERKRFEEDYAEYNLVKINNSGEMKLEISFSYDDSDGKYMDPVAYRMTELFFLNLSDHYPAICGAASFRYEPRKENLEKGYDDYGGYMELRLYDGVVYKSDTPIV